MLRHIRALAPAPGAWTEIEGALVVVTEARPASSYPAVLLPGEAVWDAGRALVRTGDGAVELVRVEIDEEPATAEILRCLIETPAAS